MLASRLLFRLARCLLLICIISTVYLYLYPLFKGCAFPSPAKQPRKCSESPDSDAAQCLPDVIVPATAPFRLLALGDPQLEGDSSLPKPEDPVFPSLRDVRADIHGQSYTEALKVVGAAGLKLVKEDIPRLLWSCRKRLDLLGNDYYLAHIYRTLHWWTQPTHVTVLGDLLGSQWVSDAEFERRAWRFWNRVFKGGEMVKEDVMAKPTAQKLGADPEWSRRIINIAGNHDVGYAGDIDDARIARFEKLFGCVNWEMTFQLPINSSDSALKMSDEPSTHSPDSIPQLRLVVLNSMNLDGPAISEALQGKTYTFINEVITRSLPVEDSTHATILLTHIPLHKESGVCVDSPFFSFFPPHQGGGVKEQNHISDHGSNGILEGIFGKSGNVDAPARGMGRKGIILNGHDHEGCDVYHFHPRNESSWKAERWGNAKVKGLLEETDMPGLREVTVRSMMGDFGGNAGLLSAWWDGKEWKFEFANCGLGVQHWWWAVHIIDSVTVGVWVAACVVRAVEKNHTRPLRKPQVKKGLVKAD